jgi:hypothetical protein
VEGEGTEGWASSESVREAAESREKSLTQQSLWVITTTVKRLNDLDAKEIVMRLTHHGSEFQQEVSRRQESDTPIALVRSGPWRVAAWAASHNWRDMQTLEGFTLEHFRRRGMARLAAASLVSAGVIIPTLPLAVFAPYCVAISKSVGCRDVRLFERSGDDWIETT